MAKAYQLQWRQLQLTNYSGESLPTTVAKAYQLQWQKLTTTVAKAYQLQWRQPRRQGSGHGLRQCILIRRGLPHRQAKLKKIRSHKENI